MDAEEAIRRANKQVALEQTPASAPPPKKSKVQANKGAKRTKPLSVKLCQEVTLPKRLKHGKVTAEFILHDAQENCGLFAVTPRMLLAYVDESKQRLAYILNCLAVEYAVRNFRGNETALLKAHLAQVGDVPAHDWKVSQPAVRAINFRSALESFWKDSGLPRVAANSATIEAMARLEGDDGDHARDGYKREHAELAKKQAKIPKNNERPIAENGASHAPFVSHQCPA